MEKPTRNKILLAVAVALTLGLAWYGYKNWGWFGGATSEKDKWVDDCVKRMAKNGVTIPNYKQHCEAQWDNEHKDTEGFPSNPKDQDKFTKDGKVYIFRAINCITTPCEGGTWVLFNEGDTPKGNQSFALGGKIGDLLGNRSTTPTTTSGSGGSSNPVSGPAPCWKKDWTDAIKRNYHFEIKAKNCNSLYVGDAINNLMNMLNNGNLNHPNVLNNFPLMQIVNDINASFNQKYSAEVKAGLMSFGISGNGTWAGQTPPISLPTICDPKRPGYDTYGQLKSECGGKPHKWNLYLVTKENSKNTAVLRGTSPVPTQLKAGQKIDVTLSNPWNQEPDRNYKATIVGFTSNPLEMVTDIPYVGLTNLPPNIIPTMGSGHVMY